jgi:hypothetical protein
MGIALCAIKRLWSDKIKFILRKNKLGGSYHKDGLRIIG